MVDDRNTTSILTTRTWTSRKERNRLKHAENGNVLVGVVLFKGRYYHVAMYYPMYSMNPSSNSVIIQGFAKKCLPLKRDYFDILFDSGCKTIYCTNGPVDQSSILHVDERDLKYVTKPSKDMYNEQYHTSIYTLSFKTPDIKHLQPVYLIPEALSEPPPLHFELCWDFKWGKLNGIVYFVGPTWQLQVPECCLTENEGIPMVVMGGAIIDPSEFKLVSGAYKFSHYYQDKIENGCEHCIYAMNLLGSFNNLIRPYNSSFAVARIAPHQPLAFILYTIFKIFYFIPDDIMKIIWYFMPYSYHFCIEDLPKMSTLLELLVDEKKLQYELPTKPTMIKNKFVGRKIVVWDGEKEIITMLMVPHTYEK